MLVGGLPYFDGAFPKYCETVGGFVGLSESGCADVVQALFARDVHFSISLLALQTKRSL